MAGKYRLKIEASVAAMKKVTASYTIELELFSSGPLGLLEQVGSENNSGDIIVAINSTGAMNYELPEDMQDAKIDLRQMSSFVSY